MFRSFWLLTHFTSHFLNDSVYFKELDIISSLEKSRSSDLLRKPHSGWSKKPDSIFNRWNDDQLSYFPIFRHTQKAIKQRSVGCISQLDPMASPYHMAVSLLSWRIPKSPWVSIRSHGWFFGDWIWGKLQISHMGMDQYLLIPFFGGMNIHLPAILMFTRGTRFWRTAISRFVHRFCSQVWEYKDQGGTFGGTNRPYAGAWGEDKPLEKGEHKIQLYSMGTPPLGRQQWGELLEENSEQLDGWTRMELFLYFLFSLVLFYFHFVKQWYPPEPADWSLPYPSARNGVKVTILLEELVEAFPDFEYDAWLIPINGVQFTSGFNAVNPNSKIPAMLDYSDPAKPVRVFESGSILLYLCDKFDKEGKFFPREYPARAECQNWLMWQMGSAPFIGGGFGHFYHYAPLKRLVFWRLCRFLLQTSLGPFFWEDPKSFPRTKIHKKTAPFTKTEDWVCHRPICHGDQKVGGCLG